MDRETNNMARQAVISSIGATGGPGKAIGIMIGIVWAEGDIWDDMKTRVEALINKKLAEAKYQDVKESLQGLHNALDTYRSRLKDGSAIEKGSQYDTTETLFVHDLPHFQSEGNELLLLPLFAQFANLHLTLLQDGCQYGSQWGWNTARLEDEKLKLSNLIRNYTSYATRTFETGLAGYESSNDRQKWFDRNRFTRIMTFDALDHAHYWQFFNPFNTTPIWHPKRILYTEPIGGAFDDTIAITDPHENGPRLVSIRIWGGQSGVWGVGPQYGGSLTSEAWVSGNASQEQISILAPEEYIVGLSGRLGPPLQDEYEMRRSPYAICSELNFTIDGGGPLRGQRMFAASNPYSAPWEFRFPGYVLATAHCIGGRYGTFLFGFRLKESYSNPPGH